MSSPTPSQNPYEPPADPESVAAVLAAGFSREFRRRYVERNGRAVLFISILTPTAVVVAGGFAKIGQAGGIWWALPVAVLATWGLLRVANNRLSLRGYEQLGAALSQRLLRERIDVRAWNGIFVQLAPADRPRVYHENFTEWDVGFLFLLRGRLVYVGDLTRFALPLESIIDMRLGRGAVSRRNPEHFYITYRMPDGSSATFNLWPGAGRSLAELRQMSREFAEHLDHWRTASLRSAWPSEPLWAEIGPPVFDSADAAGISPRELARPVRFLAALLGLALVGTLASGCLFGIVSRFVPLGWDGLIVVALSLVMSVSLEFMPLLFYRDEPGTSAAA